MSKNQLIQPTFFRQALYVPLAWPFGDFVFSWDYDFFADGTKARRLGFHKFMDTKQMFYQLFDEMRKKRIIPY
jgi:hypothetical protein